ncbi:MAG: hypothetical protein KI786_09480 [Mameliella sp.]|nr:hypothetical protein [Phaeodactylibacter sp.]
MSKKVILTGGTGMTGSLVQQLCLEYPEIQSVISLVRRPSGVNHPKLKEVLVEDFTALRHLESEFSDVDAGYFCLGVYTGAVTRDRFREITVDMPVAFARQLTALSPNARMVLLSGAGADRTEQSRMMFAKDKGVAENQLSSLLKDRFFAIRPGYIYPVTPRKEPGFSYSLMRRLYPLLKLMGPKYSIKSTELAEGIFKAGLNGAPKEILENDEILDTLK